MPKKIKDPNTGAIIFELTDEEKRIKSLEERVDKLEKERDAGRQPAKSARAAKE